MCCSAAALSAGCTALETSAGRRGAAGPSGGRGLVGGTQAPCARLAPSSGRAHAIPQHSLKFRCLRRRPERQRRRPLHRFAESWRREGAEDNALDQTPRRGGVRLAPGPLATIGGTGWLVPSPLGASGRLVLSEGRPPGPSFPYLPQSQKDLASGRVQLAARPFRPFALLVAETEQGDRTCHSGTTSTRSLDAR
jgi:hypothetical protein